MPCICYELEISWEIFFAAILRPAKSVKILNLENFRLYGIISACIFDPIELTQTLAHKISLDLAGN